VGDQISDVIAASFPHIDSRRRVAALVQSCSRVAMIMLPLSIGLAAVAPTVVETFFAPEWADVGVMLVWLSALSAAPALADVLPSYFYASPRPGVVLGREGASLAGIVASLMTVGRVNMHAACAGIG